SIAPSQARSQLTQPNPTKKNPTSPYLLHSYVQPQLPPPLLHLTTDHESRPPPSSIDFRPPKFSILFLHLISRSDFFFFFFDQPSSRSNFDPRPPLLYLHDGRLSSTKRRLPLLSDSDHHPLDRTRVRVAGAPPRRKSTTVRM
ncbi:hypothetical protein LINGRAHAP2_LOCUS22996, partial [Linum grandiflorum]